MRSVKYALATAVLLPFFGAFATAQEKDPMMKGSDAALSNGVMMAGEQAEALCKSLASTFKPKGLDINNTFAQYFPEGMNPSIELLSKLYPNGTLPKGVNLPKIFDTLGPDADIKSDAGYGKSSTRAGRNGPLGGLPAFCRFGAFVKTSNMTKVLSEVWLPLAQNDQIELAPANASDYPQNTTSFLIGANGDLTRVPLFVVQNKTDKDPKPQPGAKNPPAPNDYPDPAEMTKEKKTDNSTKSSTTMTMASQPPSRPGDQEYGGSSASRKAHAHRKKSGASIPGDMVLGKGDAWNGRLVVQGNGGQRGFVPFPDMKLLMSRYRFAVAGSNAGHFSPGSGVVWVNGTQLNETLVDFGYRASHVTLQLAEQVIDAFYGPTAGKRSSKDQRVHRYYVASSVGAARGLSAMSSYPTDFQGVLLGPPANDFMSMNVGQLHTSAVHNKTVVKDGFFTQGALAGPIKNIVLEQCDHLDGVKDGVISDPLNCKPDITAEILCGGQGKYSSSNGTCLTKEQLLAVKELYKPTTLEGHVVYPRYLPGLEDSASSMTGMNAKANGWTQLVVYKQPQLNSSFNPFTDIHYDDLIKGIMEDPGRVNAQETDYSDFVKAGGKMLMYQGTNDLVVSPVHTIEFYERMINMTQKRGIDNAAERLKMFLIPGMRHSRGGPGAWNFGGASQTDAGSRPLHYSTRYDMLLALVHWVEGKDGNEGGRLPHTQVAAAYTLRSAILPERAGSNDAPEQDLGIPTTLQNYNWGLQFTRPLCAWPTQAKYKGGDASGAQGYRAFACE